MNLLVMSCLYPKENEQLVRSKIKHAMYDAANALQWNIVSGICCSDPPVNLSLINLLPVDSYPQKYSDWFVEGFDFCVNGKPIGKNIPYINIKYVKHLLMNGPFCNACATWARAHDEDCRVLLYSLNSTFLSAAKKIKQINRNAKIYAVVADLPEFSTASGNALLRLYRKIYLKKITNYLKYIDGYVLLTELMAEKLKITQPYIVMEGIAPTTAEPAPRLCEDKYITVVYTGSMNVKYGILTLLEAFEKIPSENYRLVLCGLGDAEREIQEVCKQDPRVQFLGIIPHEEVLVLQQASTVLVNPRQNNEEFTKYSFPSKTMEYLAAGVPVVAYKLDGIPDAYDEYLNYVHDNSPETLAKVIMQICEKTPAERRAMGEKGRNFVLTEKNHVRQAGRILDLLR